MSIKASTTETDTTAIQNLREHARAVGHRGTALVCTRALDGDSECLALVRDMLDTKRATAELTWVPAAGKASRISGIARKAKIIADAWPDLNASGRAEVVKGIAALPSFGAAYVSAYVADRLDMGFRADFVKALAREIG